MEIFFTKYLWIVILGMLALTALLFAAGTNRLLASSLLLPPPVPLVIESGAQRQGSSEERGSTILARSVFDSSRLAPPPEEPIQDGNGDQEQLLDGEAGELGEHVPLSELNVELTGTVVSTVLGSSNASIRDSGQTRLFMEGEEVKDSAVLYAIRRDVAYLTRNGCLERLILGEKKGAGKGSNGSLSRRTSSLSHGSSSSKRSSRKKWMASVQDGIKKTGADEYEIDRGMLDEQLQDLNRLGSQARIIPHYKSGKADGFKLVGIRPGSLYTYIGIRSGDVIRRVNGEEISSPTKALALYDKLRTTSQVSIDIERRGKPKTLAYTIK